VAVAVAVVAATGSNHGFNARESSVKSGVSVPLLGFLRPHRNPSKTTPRNDWGFPHGVVCVRWNERTSVKLGPSVAVSFAASERSTGNPLPNVPDAKREDLFRGNSSHSTTRPYYDTPPIPLKPRWRTAEGHGISKESTFFHSRE
jgi:hypothetical protein